MKPYRTQNIQNQPRTDNLNDVEQERNTNICHQNYLENDCPTLRN